MGTRREKILQKLNPKLLKMTPKLSGDVGSFIDLDTDDSLEDGAKNLMIRFLRNQDLLEKNKRNSSQNVTELTISSAKYSENNEICEIISERLTLPHVKNDADDLSERPGKRLQKLKMELQEKMSAKWEEEYKKRVSGNKVYSQSMHKHKKKSSDEENSGNELELENEENEDVDGKGNSSDEEFGDDGEGFESDGASTAGEEPASEDTCGKSEENKPERDDDCDSADGCSLIPAYQPGGGMLYGGSELTQSEEGLPQNLLTPSLRLSINESPPPSTLEFQSINDTTPKKAVPEEELGGLYTEVNNLFSQNPNDSCDLNEAFEFCSGKFPDSEGCSAPQLKTGTQENLQEENSNEFKSSVEQEREEFEEEDNEEKSQTSNAENEQEILRTRKSIIVFEDSDEEEEIRNDASLDEPEESQFAAPELLSEDEGGTAVDDKLKKRKKPKTLHFSDEEDSVNDCLDKEDENSNSAAIDKDELESEDEQRSVHYDSEENEIVNPKEFFEKEAELSGSEWSGDEDERGLDEFDVEEGDADKIDDDQVRSQLEKIHIRRVLDEDAREVRLIQEILFEDGDLHSDGKRRDRKFKWKNLGTFEENLNEGELKEDGDCSSEDDGAMEEELRKIRHEKELFLMTKKKNGDVSSDEEIVEDFHAVKVTSVKDSIKSSNVESLENSKTIIDYTKNAAAVCNARGSFLTRNEQFLSKLAKATSGVTDNVLGPKSSKNFVFATKSPEKKNQDKTTVSKRQIEDSESCRRDKKIKLLLPEMDKEPSILDLLV